MKLRPYQSEAIETLRDALRTGFKRPVLQLPTGGGKTAIAAEIVKLATGKGRRATFTCPRIELIDQTARAFYEHGLREIGVIQASHPMTDPSKALQIASVQTLERRTLPETDLVIVDEAHIRSKVIERWMETAPELPFVGLSASPWSKGLGRLYNRLIVASTTKRMIVDGYLSPFRVYAPSHPDLSDVKTRAGDYVEEQLSEAMQRGSITADIVSTWLERAENRPTLVFCVDRAHAMAVQKSFERQGIASAYVDGDTPRLERDRIRRAFAAGEYQVVVSIGVLTVGVDWDVRCIVFARPTKSEILYLQCIGRGLRPVYPPGFDQETSTAEGRRSAIGQSPKPYCLILDHSDTTMKLGFVTDIHHERLDDGTLAGAASGVAAERKPRECASCKVLLAKFVRACPNCGFEPKPQARDVEVLDGELVELDGKRKGRSATMIEKRAFIAQLRAYAIERNLKDGWVAHKFRAKFGVWPDHPDLRYAPAASGVSPAVRSWIKSQQIRWAKSRERREEVA